MSVTHHELAGCRDTVMDCRAHNERQALLVLNPSAEQDSLAEDIVALRRHGVPEDLVQRMLSRLRELYVSNHREGCGEQHLAGALDGFAAAAHAAARMPRPTRPAGVKRLAAEIRSAMDAGDDELRALLLATPRSRLVQQSLSHELGRGRGQRLMAALGELDRPGVTA